eukprot:TRINITY_DN14106_c0_g1_i1.p1 TRINITY_DN14106_c0_g1~~TRINITY_DN14106_c0_g1_i1.p1  ORF type:complete len:254 (-),score=49.85 TRINITY_DN14106_c0_g1_i1:78-731(-)
MDPSKLYIQIGPVTPHYPAGETLERVTPHEMCFNITSFLLETGYSAEGKNVAKEGLAHQQKKKTIFSVGMAFPAMTPRLEVVSSSEVIISPLENAIELIEGRIAALKAQLNTNPPRLNALQSVIQGSVVTMVNEGPLKICETFLPEGPVLDPSGKPYPPELLMSLRVKMSEFIRMCGFAIRLNKSLISAEHLPFQGMVQVKYDALAEAVKIYLEGVK